MVEFCVMKFCMVQFQVADFCVVETLSTMLLYDQHQPLQCPNSSTMISFFFDLRTTLLPLDRLHGHDKKAEPTSSIESHALMETKAL